jgi:alanyl-tRNA synthetase
MLGSELRTLYLKYFESKGALRLPSDSLVTNDPTLLFTVAGMVPLVPYFLGEQEPPRRSVTTVQKCLRTNDIDGIGDSTHCTFFEMLGNFSFGDYFKKEAIAWSWEFLMDVLKLDLARLRVSIYKDDVEAYELWKSAGMPENKIFLFDQDKNYWPANVIADGPNTACGPCTEIFFDTQPDHPATPDGVWDDNRWLEIWNNVFTQFERKDGGVLTPLPRKNIDTGMGLERTTAAINDLRGPFETDLFKPILDSLSSLSGKIYTKTEDAKHDIALRRVADHVRAMTFLIGDGVLPSNVGRGYVLRRLMRRAILAGRNTLGFEKPFLASIVPTIVAEYQEVYPELKTRESTILRYTDIEEVQFRKTLTGGSERLNGLLDTVEEGETLSGDDVFVLFATYGFPVEMTKEIASERRVGIDQPRFEERLAEHALISNAGREREVMVKNVVVQSLRQSGVPSTLFTGYSEPVSSSTVVAIVAGNELIPEAFEGDSVQLLLDQTPFYAESGGQVGDTGRIHADHAEVAVRDTQKDSGYFFHRITITAGAIKVGDRVNAQIDADRRDAIRRNHSSTHLLQNALQTVLGDHVQQRGSLVDADRLRFDFSHDKSLTADEIRRVEAIVNEEILADYPVETMEKPIEEAKKLGARMLFGEKYGASVRVVNIGPSLEFCGGTHVAHTSQAGLFKVTSEGSSQAGVRRIEGVTGQRALLKILDQERILADASVALKTTPTHLVGAVEKLLAELKARDKELEALHKAAAMGQVDELLTQTVNYNGVKLVIATVPDADADALRTLSDELLGQLKSGIIILGSPAGGKVSLAVKVSKDLVDRTVNAGAIVKAAAGVAGGGGGGRPEFAQAGAKDVSKLSEALLAAQSLAESLLDAAD